MSDTIHKIITVDVSGAVSSLSEMREETESAGYSFKSLGDAKKYIDKLRASLIDLEEGSSEYIDTVSEINKIQTKVNEAMKASAETAKNAEGSYNALSKQMSELKKAWKETSDEAERAAIGKQIVSINDKLKDFDASIGNYQRNVGNYGSAFTKGIEDISKRITELGNPLAIAKKGVTALSGAFEALIANPVGGVIMGIVGVIKLLKKGFESSEEATNSLKKAFAAIEPIINLVKNAISTLAEFVGKTVEVVANGVSKMLSLISKSYAEAQKESAALVQAEQDLVKKTRELEVEISQTQVEIAELRNKAAQKDKYTAQERSKFLEEAIKKEQEISDKKVALAETEFDIAKRRAAQTHNNKADNDALAAAEIKVNQARADGLNKTREVNSQLAELHNKLNATTKSTNELDEALKKMADDIDKQLEDEFNAWVDGLNEVYEIQTKLAREAMDPKALELMDLSTVYNKNKSLFEEYGEDTTDLTEKFERDKAAIIEKYAKEAEEKRKQIQEEAASKGEDRISNVDDETALQTFIADKTIQIEYEKEQKILEIERNGLEEKKAIYEELLANDDISLEKKQEYADRLAEINASIDENSRQRTISEKNHINDIVQTYSQAASSIGDLMGTISDIWQASIKERQKNGEITEEQAKEEFEQSKKLQIASALITGIAGVASALACTYTTHTGVWDIALGIAQAATIAASTALQISKIKSTSFDSGGSGASISESAASSPTAAATAYVPDYTTNITGASDTTNLANAVKEGQSSQKIYVLESDINEAGKKASVRENESTF